MTLKLLASLVVLQAQPATTQFEQVCDVLEQTTRATCEDLQPPAVVYTKATHYFNVYGLYFKGDDVIMVRPNMTDEKTNETIVHETVHYVVWKLNLIRTRCVSEEVAREWTAKITGLPLDTTWRERYKCQQ